MFKIFLIREIEMESYKILSLNIDGLRIPLWIVGRDDSGKSKIANQRDELRAGAIATFYLNTGHSKYMQPKLHLHKLSGAFLSRAGANSASLPPFNFLDYFLRNGNETLF